MRDAPIPVSASGTRRGAALFLAMAMVVTIAAMAVVLTEMTVSRNDEQMRRQNEVRLLVACESAAHEAMDWMQANPNLMRTLAQNPRPNVVALAGTLKQLPPPGSASAAAVTPWVRAKEVPPTSNNWVQMSAPELIEAQFAAANNSTIVPPNDNNRIISSSGAGTTMYPALMVNYPTTQGGPRAADGQQANMRNSCNVEALVVCLKGTEAGNTWPDGYERYLVFVTATIGSRASDGDQFMRRRVATVVSTSSQKVFKQTMYALDSYDFMGNAMTDSWQPGPGVLPPPWDATTANGNGDIVSGGTLRLRGSADPHGQVIQNHKVELPALTYDPPAGAPYTASLSAYRELTGPTTVRYGQITSSGDIHIRGSGTVEIYVDGPINMDRFTFDPASTANVIIRQKDYNPASYGGALTQLTVNGGDTIGDVGNQAAGIAPDPKRFVFISNFSGTMKWNGNGKMSGVIFAPYANLALNGTFTMWGSVVAKAFDTKVNGTFKFIYDESLSNLALPINPQLTAAGWHSTPIALQQR